MTIALVGNQNSGKTTLYNAISGSRRRVGNFPGVTVDVETRRAKGTDGVMIADLPGVYSLAPASGEEAVTAEYLRTSRPDAIINVVDASCPERGLYLTTQVIGLGIPTVVAFNMMDEVRRRGGHVDVDGLGRALGVPAVGVSASHGEGVEVLVPLAVKEAGRGRQPRRSFAGGEVEDSYRYIDDICRKYVMQVNNSCSRLDDIVLGKYTAYPVFFALIACVFYLTFNVIGNRISELLSLAVRSVSGALSAQLTEAGVSTVMVGLVTDGALSGVGAVLSFLPTVLTLFFFLSIIEDSGYMARVAFIMDAPFRALGLSGKSAVPLLLGFGCSVPAIMATRTLPTRRDRAVTAALVPFMSCGAKIPIYALFAAAFFPGREGAVTAALYGLGILIAVTAAFLLKRLSPPRGEGTKYILELPPWRLPTPGGVWRIMRQKAGELLSRVFGVVFLTSIVMWAASAFDLTLSATPDEDASILAAVGRLTAPLLAPLGFGDWRASAALFAGLSAKEAVIGTLAVLTGGELASVFTPASALSFMTFTLLYTPCSAAVSAMGGELGGPKKTLPLLLIGLAAAYALSLLVYTAASAVMGGVVN